MAQNNAVSSLYFSGQGIVSIAERDANGNALGFRNVGNVTELTLAVEQTTLEHKESSTGQRATDKRITQETQVNVGFTLESFVRENLAYLTYGDATTVPGASITDEPHVAKLDKTLALAHPQVSAVSVTGTGGTPTYVDGDNYTINAETGSINILDSAAQTAATDAIAEDDPLEISYTHDDYENVEALTQARSNVWLRFEGLNTAEGNEPVIVDIYSLDTDPLQELALIQDEFASFAVEGFALADQNRSSGSKFFTIKYQTPAQAAS